MAESGLFVAGDGLHRQEVDVAAHPCTRNDQSRDVMWNAKWAASSFRRAGRAGEGEKEREQKRALARALIKRSATRIFTSAGESRGSIRDASRSRECAFI